MHLLGGEVQDGANGEAVAPPPAAAAAAAPVEASLTGDETPAPAVDDDRLETRLTALEQEVTALRAQLDELVGLHRRT